MRRWYCSLLIACLLLAQQGLLMHGLGHSFALLDAATAPAGEAAPVGHSQPADDPCPACLAFVQVAAALSSQPPAAALLTGLAHARLAAAPLPVGALAPTTPRSRGPPPLT